MKVKYKFVLKIVKNSSDLHNLLFEKIMNVENFKEQHMFDIVDLIESLTGQF